MYLYLEEVSFLKNYLSIIYEIDYSLIDFFLGKYYGGTRDKVWIANIEAGTLLLGSSVAFTLFAKASRIWFLLIVNPFIVCLDFIYLFVCLFIYLICWKWQKIYRKKSKGLKNEYKKKVMFEKGH